jgi:serine/threonine protein kinase
MGDRTDKVASAAFSREFEACCKSDHPRVVPVYGFTAATRRSQFGLVMKYMEGGSLDSVLKKVKGGNPLVLWTHTGIAIIVVCIVSGLEFIHKDLSIAI